MKEEESNLYFFFSNLISPLSFLPNNVHHDIKNEKDKRVFLIKKKIIG